MFSLFAFWGLRLYFLTLVIFALHLQQEQQEVDLICPQGTPQLKPIAESDESTCPTVLLDRKTVTLKHLSTRPIFKFDLASSTADAFSPLPIVLLERVVGGKSEVTSVACGEVEPGSLYRLPSSATLSPGDILRLTIFDSLADAEKDREKKLAKQRQAALVTSTYAEEEVAAKAQLADLRKKLAQATSRSDPPEANALAQRALGEAIIRLKNLGDCDVASATPVELVICNAADKYLLNLIDIRSRFKAVHATDRGSPPADQEIGLRRLVESLPNFIDNDSLLAHCKTTGRLKWWQDEHLRAVVRHEIPVLRPDDRFVITGYGLGDTPVSDVWSSQYVGALLLNAPIGDTITVNPQRSLVLALSPPELVAQLITAIGVVAQANIPKAYIGQSAVQLEPPPLCENVTAVLDDAADTLAQQTTKAVAIGPSGGDYRNEVSICASDKCGDDTRRNKLVVTSRSEVGAVLLVEQSINEAVGLIPSNAHLSRARFDAIGGAAGPDQLYQLTYTLDPRDLFATSLLLGVHWRSLGAAFGPAFLVGTKLAALTQWSFRGTVEVTRGLLVTAGMGIRLVPTAVDWQDGDIVAVPRLAGDVAAPVPRTVDLGQLVLGAGIAVDLGVLTDGGAALLKGIGASK